MQGIEEAGLGEDVLHLWCLPQDARSREQLTEEGHSLLSPGERQTLAGMSSNARVRSFLLGRTLLRRALAHHLDCAPQDLVFGERDGGKLYLVGPEVCSCDFSLSHARGESLVAVARAVGLGIDLEAENRSSQVLKIARRLFSQDERRHLASAGAQAATQALCLWTLKEAVTKALGETIWQAVGQTAFSVGAMELGWLSAPPRGKLQDWTLLSGRFRQGHRFAAAIWDPRAVPGSWRLRGHVAGEEALPSETFEITASAGGWRRAID